MRDRGRPVFVVSVLCERRDRRRRNRGGDERRVSTAFVSSLPVSFHVRSEVAGFTSLLEPCGLSKSLPLPARRWNPAHSALLPRVVGQDVNVTAVGTHDADLAVRLRTAQRQRELILESLPRSAEGDPLAVWRPFRVRIVAARMRQSAKSAAVGIE